MDEYEWLAGRFEENRPHLVGVAYRMLGSLSEADDAVQEAWLRLSRSDAGEIDNLSGWLTTVIARISLDMLRSRTSRREEALEGAPAAEPVHQLLAANPEQEALLADSVGLALLVVLDRLNPAERLAFVLHDLFDLPFDEIASILGRSPDATRQLASRARRRVRGAQLPGASLQQQREVASKFLAALRSGDLEKLVALLDPGLVVHADATAARAGAATDTSDVRNWAAQALRAAQGARLARLALVDGTVGLIVAPKARLFRAIRFSVTNGRVAGIELIGDPEHLNRLELAVLENED